MTIQFRDRSLKSWEKSHYYCDKCDAEIHPDMIHKHKCSIFKTDWSFGRQSQEVIK